MAARASLLLICMALPLAAQAGRSCEQKPMTTESVVRGLNLASKTMNALDASGAKMVILARAGQDLSKYSIRYSHLGLAYSTPDGWRVIHKLNTCGTSVSNLYEQGLGEFFLDDPWRYEAAWAIPTSIVQDKLHTLLSHGTRAVSLHQPEYSLVSYVWGTKYQQSNQWAIETLALAMDPSAQTRSQAQDWLQRARYEPTTLTLRPLTRLGGRVSSANVAFDDHPDSKRFADKIETVTADSVFAWLEREQLAGPLVVLPE